MTGRDFISGNPADSKACLINEAAVGSLGTDMSEAIGLTLENARSHLPTRSSGLQMPTWRKP